MKLILTESDFEILASGQTVRKGDIEITLENADLDTLLRCIEDVMSKGRGRQADG